ncbi:MAG: tripartite tricarboxylate transporter TctB family protein [Rectinemataceae bacterium]|nr:tripartite tricarboxylate transporter TctB family protein [Spirochaetaceae bacterium]
MSTASTEKRHFSINQIIPVVSAIIAIVFVWLGLSKYGFWNEQQGPMSGFYPTIIGIGLFLMSIVGFIFSFKDKTPIFPADSWMAVLGALGIIAASFLIGLIPSAGIYVILWLRWYEKLSWKTTLLTFAVIMAIVIGCFVLWLQVPFPRGMILDAIMK